MTSMNGGFSLYGVYKPIKYLRGNRLRSLNETILFIQFHVGNLLGQAYT